MATRCHSLRFRRSSFFAVRDCRLIVEMVGRYFLLRYCRHGQQAGEQQRSVKQTWFLYRFHNLLRPTSNWAILCAH